MWGWLKRAVYTLLWVVALGLAVAGAVNYAVARYQSKQPKEMPFVATALSQRGDFAVYTDQVGNLEAEESKVVKAETSGQVIGVMPNGTVVKQGDVIVALDVPRMLQAVEDAQRKVREAQDKVDTTQHDREADIQQAELGLKKAEMDSQQSEAAVEADRKDREAQLKFDEEALAEAGRQLERQRRLAQEQLIPGQQVRQQEVTVASQRFALEKEQQNLQLSIAKAKSESISREAQISMAQSTLKRAKDRRDDDLRSAKTDLETQQRQLQRAHDDLEKAFIRAPKAGLVALRQAGRGYEAGGRPLQEGDLVRNNQAIAEILDPAAIRVHLELPQRVGEMAKRGQRATVSVHGLPGDQFPGEVTQVASFASQADRGFGPPTEERSFRTYVHVSKFKAGLLKPGMRATVRIMIAQIKGVVSVPSACVFTRGFGKGERKIVWVRRGDTFLAAPVKLGEANEDSVIIESGMGPAEEVALRDLQSEIPHSADEAVAASTPAPAVSQDKAAK
jgi:multidrug efflux pump subunit AcrA (membrane-fusion protein)